MRPIPAPLSSATVTCLPELLRTANEPERDCRVHQQDRNDTRMRLIIEQGIAQDASHGSVAAWRFMSSQGVPEPLILRVLSEPSRRRATDSNAAEAATRHDSPALPAVTPGAPPP